MAPAVSDVWSKIGLVLLLVGVALGCFLLSPWMAPLAVFIGDAIFRPGKGVPSNGSPAQQLKQGLADSKTVVAGLQSGEQQTQAGLAGQATSLDEAGRAVDAGIGELTEIAKANP